MQVRRLDEKMEQRWQREIEERLLESAEVKRRTAQQCGPPISRAAEAIASGLRSGGKLMLCGNGGSAADCQHIAAEFIGRLGPGLERDPWPAIALTTNTSNLTAVGNDYGFEDIFSRQVEALGARGDVLVAISTSGKSKNIIKAVEKAKEKGVLTIGLLGDDGGLLAARVDLAIMVPSDNMQRIQEAHITICHIVSELVEQMLTTQKAGVV